MEHQELVKLAYAYGVSMALQEVGLNKEAANQEAAIFTEQQLKLAAEDGSKEQADYSSALSAKSPIDIATLLSPDPVKQQEMYNIINKGQTRGALIGSGIGALGGGGLGAALAPKGSRLGGSILGALLAGSVGSGLGRRPGRAGALEDILKSTEGA